MVAEEEVVQEEESAVAEPNLPCPRAAAPNAPNSSVRGWQSLPAPTAVSSRSSRRRGGEEPEEEHAEAHSSGSSPMRRSRHQRQPGQQEQLGW